MCDIDFGITWSCDDKLPETIAQLHILARDALSQDTARRVGVDTPVTVVYVSSMV